MRHDITEEQYEWILSTTFTLNKSGLITRNYSEGQLHRSIEVRLRNNFELLVMRIFPNMPKEEDLPVSIRGKLNRNPQHYIFSLFTLDEVINKLESLEKEFIVFKAEALK